MSRQTKYIEIKSCNKCKQNINFIKKLLKRSLNL